MHCFRYKTSWFGQFGPVLWRSWVTNIRDPALLRGRIIHGLVSGISLVISTVFTGRAHGRRSILPVNTARRHGPWTRVVCTKHPRTRIARQYFLPVRSVNTGAPSTRPVNTAREWIQVSFWTPVKTGCRDVPCSRVVRTEHSYWRAVIDKDAVIINLLSTYGTQLNNNNRFTTLCPGLPGWAGTRRNTHPPTILIIIQSLSASSVYHDPQYPPCSNYVLGNLFAQPFIHVYLQNAVGYCTGCEHWRPKWQRK